MRLLVDLDGVCTDFYGYFLARYNADFRDCLKLEDLTRWDLNSETYPKATKAQLYSYFDLPGFWYSLPPMPNCREVLNNLYERNHDLVIVTAVPESSHQSMYEKMAWVKKHLPFIKRDNFVATRRKSIVRGDLLLDDGPHNLKEFPGVTCAMDAPYNRAALADYRVRGWKEFEELVEKL